MKAIICKTGKSAMQSGGVESLRMYTLSFINSDPNTTEYNSFGWMGSENTQKQIVLIFDTLESATQYCKRNNIEFEIAPESPQKIIKPKAYSENFTSKV